MTTDPALRALALAQKLGYDLVNDHRGIPYDVIERVDEIAAALAAAEAAPTDANGDRPLGYYEAAPLDVELRKAVEETVKVLDIMVTRQTLTGATTARDWLRTALAATSREPDRV